MVELGLRSGAWLMTNITQEESSEPVNEQENSSNETSKESETQTIVTHPLLTALALSSIGLLLLLVGLLILILRKNS
jgi:Na+/glutamate symporter